IDDLAPADWEPSSVDRVTRPIDREEDTNSDRTQQPDDTTFDDWDNYEQEVAPPGSRRRFRSDRGEERERGDRDFGPSRRTGAQSVGLSSRSAERQGRATQSGRLRELEEFDYPARPRRTSLLIILPLLILIMAVLI